MTTPVPTIGFTEPEVPVDLEYVENDPHLSARYGSLDEIVALLNQARAISSTNNSLCPFCLTLHENFDARMKHLGECANRPVLTSLCTSASDKKRGLHWVNHALQESIIRINCPYAEHAGVQSECKYTLFPDLHSLDTHLRKHHECVGTTGEIYMVACKEREGRLGKLCVYPECGFSGHAHALALHYARGHRSVQRLEDLTPTHRCGMCPEEAPLQPISLLYYHTEKYHPKELKRSRELVGICAPCRTLLPRMEYVEHMLHSHQIFACDMCEEYPGAPTSRARSVHRSKHVKLDFDPPIQCLCRPAHTFTSRDEYKLHVRKGCSKQAAPPASRSGSSLRSSREEPPRKRRRRYKMREAKDPCPQCGKRFSTEAGLRQHMRKQRHY
jgi:hypothetical protein